MSDYPKLKGTMVGTVYTLPDGTRGQVITRWFGDGCPRNVLLQRDDGTLTVRPFRGLRKLPDDDAQIGTVCAQPQQQSQKTDRFTRTRTGAQQ